MNGKIKVAHILNTGSYSGAEHVVIDLINITSDRCESVYVSKDGKIRDILEGKGIDFYPIKFMSLFEIDRLIKRVRPDIIHAHDYTAGMICSVFSGRLPIINHLHNNSPWIEKKNLKSAAYRLAARKCDYLLTVSYSIMDEYIFGEEFLCKTKVVGNPFSLSQIQRLAGMENCNEEYDIMFCGRLVLQKNPLFFVEIIKELKKKVPNIRAVMVGDGEMKGQVNTKIMQMDLGKNIALLGFLNNPYGVMQHSKVLCMPSLWEGFGMAAVEAMALGRPVFASPVGGLAGIVNDSCGKTCQSLDDYVNGIYDVLSNKELYHKKSLSASDRAKLFDNMDDYKVKIEKLYKELIK